MNKLFGAQLAAAFLQVGLSARAAYGGDVLFTALGTGPDQFYGTEPIAMSSDGSVVVGGNGRNGLGENPWIWTRTDGMRVLPGRSGSRAWVNGISGNGRVAVGQIGADAIRWIDGGAAETLTPLPHSRYAWAAATSSNGDAIVGTTEKINFSLAAWRLTAPDGLEGLGTLGEGFPHPTGISADGETVVGWDDTSQDQRAFLWTRAGGMKNLGTYANGGGWTHAHGISADGTTVVGVYASDSNSGYGYKGFTWTAQSGMRLIAPSPKAFFDSEAKAVSADGSVVVGWFRDYVTGKQGGMRWTAASGVQPISELLTGAGLDTSGWDLGNVMDVSDDGLTFVGAGMNPQGVPEAWIATIPAPGAVGCVTLLAFATGHRRRPGSAQVPLTPVANV